VKISILKIEGICSLTKCRHLYTRLHGVITQKTIISIIINSMEAEPEGSAVSFCIRNDPEPIPSLSIITTHPPTTHLNANFPLSSCSSKWMFLGSFSTKILHAFVVSRSGD
jgi:hypothetical protein